MFAQLFFCLALGVLATEAGATPARDTNTVMEDLAARSSSEQNRQIAAAAAGSSQLTRELDDLVESGKLTNIVIVQMDELKPVRGVLFNAYLNGTQIVIAAPLLKELSNNLLFDVVESDDIRPNNTTFVLAHLVHHLRTQDEINRYDAETKRQIEAVGKTDGEQKYTKIQNAGALKHIADEASALIEAWNAVVEDATARNKGRNLTQKQVATLLMNLRYRAIFFKAMTRPGTLKTNDVGIIELNVANVKAMSDALMSIPLMDVQ